MELAGADPFVGAAPCAAAPPPELTGANIDTIELDNPWFGPDSEPGPMAGPVCAALPPRPGSVTNEPWKSKTPWKEKGPNMPGKASEQQPQ